MPEIPTVLFCGVRRDKRCIYALALHWPESSVYDLCVDFIGLRRESRVYRFETGLLWRRDQALKRVIESFQVHISQYMLDGLHENIGKGGNREWEIVKASVVLGCTACVAITRKTNSLFVAPVNNRTSAYGGWWGAVKQTGMSDDGIVYGKRSDAPFPSLDPLASIPQWCVAANYEFGKLGELLKPEFTPIPQAHPGNSLAERIRNDRHIASMNGPGSTSIVDTGSLRNSIPRPAIKVLLGPIPKTNGAEVVCNLKTSLAFPSFGEGKPFDWAEFEIVAPKHHHTMLLLPTNGGTFTTRSLRAVSPQFDAGHWAVTHIKDTPKGATFKAWKPSDNFYLFTECLLTQINGGRITRYIRPRTEQEQTRVNSWFAFANSQIGKRVNQRAIGGNDENLMLVELGGITDYVNNLSWTGCMATFELPQAQALAHAQGQKLSAETDPERIKAIIAAAPGAKRGRKFVMEE